MKRSDLLNLLEASLTYQQPAYARQVALRYLADWPGDLGVAYLLARAYAAEGFVPQAVKTLEALVAADPEQFQAQRLLGDQLTALGTPSAAAWAYVCAHIGDGLGPGPAPTAPAKSGPAPTSAVTPAATGPAPAWLASARAAYLAERVGDWAAAQREAQTLIAQAAPSPLPSLIQVSALWHAGQLSLAFPLAQAFHARWPRAIAFELCLAECLLAAGDNALALEHLHDAAANDSAGQVVARHWGDNHPYRKLWPDDSQVSVSLPGPLPAGLIARLGLNRLQGSVATVPAQSTPADASPEAALAAGGPAGPTSGSKAGEMPTRPEEVADIQAQLNRVAARLSAREAGRAKTALRNAKYIILSSHTRLLQAFGMDGFTAVDTLLKTLALNASARPNTSGQRMPACVVYVDDPDSLKPFGLTPVNPSNAWDIKLLLGKLSDQLKAADSSIGALLIVGGPDIIPFHHLPNPTDDGDPDIPSDNPYATADENYFVPEWPVGRLPSPAGHNPDPLLKLLKQAAGSYTKRKSVAVWQTWLSLLFNFLSQLLPRRQAAPSPRPPSTPPPFSAPTAPSPAPAASPAPLASFGYSANVWKASSAEVYTVIGDPQALVTCPPWDAQAMPAEGLLPSRLSYFNLHGIEDGPEWYGQRSPSDPSTLPEYPVALRPIDVSNTGRAPAVVFSEACFGANILNKGVNDALSLRFMDCGTGTLVGSTKVAYGSVMPPLIGADLLGRYFWQNVNAGWPVGEALRQAKLQMAQEMHNRQGFLDGEDQKTIVSFVLYGDPMATAPNTRPPKSGKGRRPAAPPELTPVTLCDKALATCGDRPPELSPEAVSHIKAVVAQYLPGMRDAQWRVGHTRTDCASRNHLCPTGQLASAKAAAQPGPHAPRTVVTLSKTIRAGSGLAARAHPHYARVTLDDKDRVIKIAVSR